jgi:hypothetical protein
MARAAKRETDAEQDIRDQFAEFERAVLQDNIILCDQKSGILLAFAAALILVCLDGFNAPELKHAGLLAKGSRGLLVVSALSFLVCCYFALSTVIPRIRKGPDDHIFWESPVFKLPVEQYVERFRNMDVVLERDNRLRYLHTMASICRTKFRHFALALRFGQLGFVALVLAEIAHTFA